jgi:uncharacterized membrane protein (DUF373 family)
MRRVIRTFERSIVVALLSLMMIAVLVATIELGVILVQELLKPPFLLLNLEELLEVFGFFLMVLIGLELLETIKAYLAEDTVHVEVVFLVAMVAVARKVVILEMEKTSPEVLFGMSTLIVALAGGYFLLIKALTSPDRGESESDSDGE